MTSFYRNAFPLSALAVAMLGLLSGCQRQAPTDEAALPPSASTAPAIQPAPVATAYQPPTAEQLYALVSPIALFPDKLVALTLAASTHPDDVHAARGFLEDRRNLSGAALLDAADGEPWDPSVKALVAFPAVVDQLDGHGDWTAALGAAYAAEPSDVLNAIQVMRQRARAHGSLRDTAQQTIRVVDTPATATVVERDVVAPPAQTIEIEPAQPDVVYVPSYDPDAVYGEPVYSRVYTTERWYRPAPDRGDLVATGLLSFGAGVLVGELFAHEHHADRPWGWNAWRTSWGGPHGGGHGSPAVVYDNHPYVVNRTTVINRYTRIDRSVHIDNRHDFDNVSVRDRVERGTAAPPPVPPRAVDFAHVQRPTFSPAMMHATAASGRPALPPPTATRTSDAPRPAGEPARPPAGHALAERQPSHRDTTPGGERDRQAFARAPQPPHEGPPTRETQAVRERHAPTPTPIPARAQAHDEVRTPPHDDFRDASHLAQHAPQARAPEMPRPMEAHAEPHVQARAEPRPEQRPRPASAPHRDERHESGHKDDHGH